MLFYVLRAVTGTDSLLFLYLRTYSKCKLPSTEHEHRQQLGHSDRPEEETMQVSFTNQCCRT